MSTGGGGGGGDDAGGNIWEEVEAEAAAAAAEGGAGGAGGAGASGGGASGGGGGAGRGLRPEQPPEHVNPSSKKASRCAGVAGVARPAHGDERTRATTQARRIVRCAQKRRGAGFTDEFARPRGQPASKSLLHVLVGALHVVRRPARARHKTERSLPSNRAER